MSGWRQSVDAIVAAADALTRALRAGNKILVFGNGGSAADAQHFAAELMVRYERNRPPRAAMALTTDTSILTATGNDLLFEQVFARQVEALGRRGDVALAITTSGRSPNVLRALETAAARGLVTIALTGRDGGDAGSARDDSRQRRGSADGAGAGSSHDGLARALRVDGRGSRWLTFAPRR